MSVPLRRITAEQVTPAVRALFRADEPQARRCFAVLDGVPPAGEIFVDNLIDPRWAVVQENTDHSIYLGGDVNATAFKELFTYLRAAGDVLVGIWPDDPRIAFLPPGPVYDGLTLEFYHRPVGAGLDHFVRQLPPGCELVRMDGDLILRSEWGPGDVQMFGGFDIWQKYCFGFALLQDGRILSEATVGPQAIGLYEPGVFTQPDERGKGYGTIVTARLIQEIEAKGGQTYWNCAMQNLASAAIARKLGYTVQKVYRCMVWSKTA